MKYGMARPSHIRERARFSDTTERDSGAWIPLCTFAPRIRWRVRHSEGMTSWVLPKVPDGEFEFLRGLRHRMCDQETNGIGHLTALTDQAGSASYSYDSLGRMSSEQRTIWHR